MKPVILSICLLLYISANSQLNYIDVDWVIDQTIIMTDGVTDTMEFDIDQNGTNDLRIASWSNHTTGIETVIEVLLLSQTLYQGFGTDGCYSLKACLESSGTPEIGGYIYSSNCTNPSNEYVKYPFRFQGQAGIHCGLLYVRYVGTTVTFEGYAWNPTPSGSCSCTTSGWLGLAQPEPIELYGEFEYYNLLGQRIENPNGLVLKVYDSGATEKVYINR